MPDKNNTNFLQSVMQKAGIIYGIPAFFILFCAKYN